MDSIKDIADFLGKERIDDLKDFVLEQLKENLEDSIQHYWVVFPDNFNSMWEEILADVKKDLKKKYKTAITEVMSKKIDEWIAKEK